MKLETEVNTQESSRVVVRLGTSILEVITRFFRTNNGEAYYLLDSPYTFNGDDDFYIEMVTDISPGGGYLLADSVAETFRLAYDQDGSLLLSVTDGDTRIDYVKPNVLTEYMDGDVHTIAFMRTNSFYVLSVNGTNVFAQYGIESVIIDSVFKHWENIAVEPEPEPVQRYFTEVTTGSQGYDLLTDIPLNSGPIAIRARFAFFSPIIARLRPVFSGANYIELDAYADTIDFRYNNSGPSPDLIAHEEAFGDGKIVEYLVTFDGTNVEAFINGQSAGVTTRSATTTAITDILKTGDPGANRFYYESLEVWSSTNDTSTEPSFKCLFDGDEAATQEVDVIGGILLDRIGLDNTELFTYDEATTSWKNNDESVVLPVSY